MDLRFPNTLSFFAATIIDEKIWCSNLNFNGLSTYDIEKGTVNYIGMFPGHRKRQVGLHSMAIPLQDRIVFLPFFSETIDTYNFRTGFSSCKIDAWKELKRDGVFACAIDGFVNDGYVYLIPRFADMPIIKYSIFDNSVEEVITLDSIGKNRNADQVQITAGTFCYQTSAFISLIGTNKVVRYDMETKGEECITLKGINNIEGAIYVDEDILVVNADHGLAFYDSSFNLLRNVKKCVSDSEELIIRIGRYKNKIFAVPEWLGELKVFDIDDFDKQNSISVDVSDLNIKKGEVSNWRHMGTIMQAGDKLFLNPVSINRMIEIHCEDLIIDYRELIIPDRGMPARDFSRKELEKETDDLQEFISFIAEGL